MSKQKPPKKKVVVTTGKTDKNTGDKKKVATGSKAKVPRTAPRRSTTPEREALPFGRQNYLLMGLGALLIVIGLFLMSGGKMPSPDVWDESIIYGFRRTVLAPIVILAGLGVEVYAIFK
jgi:hypothetical protein